MLMLSEQQDLSGRYGVAHYLSELATMEKAAEIIEAYCVGRKSMMFCCLTNMERSRQRPC